MDQYDWIGAYGAWANALNWRNLTTGQDPAAMPPGVADDATIASLSLLVILGPAGAADLTSQGDIAYEGDFAIGGALSPSDNFTLMAASTLAAASVETTFSTFLVSGTGARLTDSGAFDLNGIILQASNHGVLQAGALTLSSNSFVTVDSTASLEVGATGGAGVGALTIDAGATASSAGIIGPRVVGNGTLIATGGTLALQDDVSGTGTLSIDAGATLQLSGTSITPGIVFTGAGATLELSADTPPNVTGTIAGFTAGDLLQLDYIEADQASLAGGTLSITNAGASVLTLDLAGSYAGQTFYVVPFVTAAGLTGSKIEVLPTIPISAAPPGTIAGQSFEWVGTSGAWADVSNWQVGGGSAATTAPGSKDNLILAALSNTAPNIVVGAGNSASIDVQDGDFAFDGTFNFGSLTVGDTLAIMAASSVTAASVSVSASGSRTNTGALVVSGTGASLTDTGSLQIGSTTGSPATLAVSNHGMLRAADISLINSVHSTPFVTIDVDDSGTLEVGASGGAVAGALTVDSDGTVDITGAINATVIDNGVIGPSGGSLTINGDVSGSGRLEIGDADTLVLAGASIATAIAFTGATGLLDLPSAPTTLSGVISGYAPGDLIRVDTTPIDKANWAATGGGLGTLTLSNAGVTVATMTLAGNYAGDTFYVSRSPATSPGREASRSAVAKRSIWVAPRSRRRLISSARTARSNSPVSPYPRAPC